MYQGFSKDNGAVIGRVGGGPQAVDLSDTQDSVGAEESLIGMDSEGYEIALTANIDPSSGDISWIPSYDVDKTKYRTVSMSQMTSMLRDRDRNRIYEAAIQQCLNSFSQRTGTPPIVMDIGCGTGLLSLLCAKHGARFTYAIEMFDMMAQIATETAGNLTTPDHVMVVNAKSTDIEELPIKIDIVVSELLDSSLLGESCIPSHVDAIQRFMKQQGTGPDECPIPIEDRVIPNRAEVYATAIQSEEIHAMVSVPGINKGREHINLYRNEFAQACHGGWPTMPVHYEALEHRGAKKLSSACPCLHIKFWQDIYVDAFTVVYEDGEPIQFKTFDTDIAITADGTVHGILLWWKTYLLSKNIDPTGSIFYSTEPGAQNWQDHWQQSIFPLPEAIPCRAGDVLRLHVSHDELSIWLSAEKVFDISKASGMKRKTDDQLGVHLNAILPRPIVDERFVRKQCNCGWHLLCGADRMMRLNNASYANVWDRVMSNIFDHLRSTSNKQTPLLLDLSDGSLLSLSFATKAKKAGLFGEQLRIVSRERKVFSALFANQLMEANELDNRMMIWDGKSMISILDYFSEGDEFSAYLDPDSIDGQRIAQQYLKIHALVSDCCYYQTHALPTWQAISFHYECTLAAPFLAPQAAIVPSQAVVMMMPMELPNLSCCYGLVQRLVFAYLVTPSSYNDITSLFCVCLCLSCLSVRLPLYLLYLFSHSLHRSLFTVSSLSLSLSFSFFLSFSVCLYHSVCGIDHSFLDQRQQLWHEYLYPYKLSNYRKKPLAKPIQVATLNYTQPISDIHTMQEIVFDQVGTCDAVVIWVDYVLENGSGSNNQTTLRFWNGFDFPPFMTQNIRFFPHYPQVKVGNKLLVQSQFMVGESDFQYSFQFVE
jgi:predicted RNA methylase